MNAKITKLFGIASILLTSLSLIACKKKENDEVDEKGNIKVSVRNLYFTDWSGGDAYTEYIQDKFKLSITPSTYSWSTWDEQVYQPANANKLTDVFHFSLDSYNYENSYKYWAKGGVIKALPDDLSKWPKLKESINSCTNIDAMKIDGKLYCIPIRKNINQNDVEYSPFTYVYRRDWARELNVYKENDIYTWDEFKALLNAFYERKCKDNNGFAALADVEWGYPSITNFFKDFPHIFATVGDNVVNNYTTDKYIEGLDIAKDWSSGNKKIYGLKQYEKNDGDVSKEYIAGRIGVFYENLSLANYTTLRKEIGKVNKALTKEGIDERTAIMRVKGPDGKYALEGTENWFSATFFNAEMSDEKLERILDMMEWTLSEEGTMMAAYGFEDVDYTISGGQVVLSEDGIWEKVDDEYVESYNGAKYLRYLATLGYDMNEYDPLVDKNALSVLNKWQIDMDEANTANNLKIIKEDPKVEWLYTPEKAKNSGNLLSKANEYAMDYCYAKTGFLTRDEYISHFNTVDWTNTLKEINDLLGK